MSLSEREISVNNYRYLQIIEARTPPSMRPTGKHYFLSECRSGSVIFLPSNYGLTDHWIGHVLPYATLRHNRLPHGC